MTASWLLLAVLMPRSATASRIAPDVTHGIVGSGDRGIVEETRSPTFTLTTAPLAKDGSIARAFHKSPRLIGHGPRNTDDEITLEAPAPSIPDGIPSPLGEDAPLPVPPGPRPPDAPQPKSEPTRAPEDRMRVAQRHLPTGDRTTSDDALARTYFVTSGVLTSLRVAIPLGNA